MLRRLGAPFVVLFGLLVKLGSFAKFGFVFVAFGGYALIWGWRFGLGVVLLIFVHEMGHWLEARREGLHPSWPVFIPFLGAYVKHTRGQSVADDRESRSPARSSAVSRRSRVTSSAAPTARAC